MQTGTSENGGNGGTSTRPKRKKTLDPEKIGDARAILKEENKRLNDEIVRQNKVSNAKTTILDQIDADCDVTLGIPTYTQLVEDIKGLKEEGEDKIKQFLAVGAMAVFYTAMVSWSSGRVGGVAAGRQLEKMTRLQAIQFAITGRNPNLMPWE